MARFGSQVPNMTHLVDVCLLPTHLLRKCASMVYIWWGKFQGRCNSLLAVARRSMYLVVLEARDP